MTQAIARMKENKHKHFFLMVNEDQVQEDETEYESLDKVDCSDLLEYSKDELAITLIKCI